MKERPILFSGPMVRALLAGRKTQTRRLVKGLPERSLSFDAQWFANVLPPTETLPKWSWWDGPPHGQSIYHTADCPYGVAGDRLWVRERHHRTTDGEPVLFGYEVDGQDRKFLVPGLGWVREFPHHLGGWGGRDSRNFPSIHMPRWASRLTLQVTDVRVERLQEISETDALAEGVREPSLGDWIETGFVDVRRASCPPVTAFALLWDKIHGPRSWSANPWVWAVSFERVEE